MTILPDLIAPALQIVFCGTAAGKRSAERRAYYAGAGNRFWPTLFEIGITPRRLEPSEYPELLALGMGLTDLAKETHGSDASLSGADFDTGRLRNLIRRYRPRVLAFTSKTAARVYFGRGMRYGWAPQREGETRFFVLPSPSGAARRYWSATPWRELAQWRTGPETGPTDAPPTGEAPQRRLVRKRAP